MGSLGACPRLAGRFWGGWGSDAGQQGRPTEWNGEPQPSGWPTSGGGAALRRPSRPAQAPCMTRVALCALTMGRRSKEGGQFRRPSTPGAVTRWLCVSNVPQEQAPALQALLATWGDAELAPGPPGQRLLFAGLPTPAAAAAAATALPLPATSQRSQRRRRRTQL